MKKLNLLFAASLMLLGLGNVQAQNDNKPTGWMWGEDFENGLDFFTDSVPADSIINLEYYIGKTDGNGTWDVNTHKNGLLKVDTIIPLFHAIAPVNNPDQRIDAVSIERDATGKHSSTLKDLGGNGGEYYMQYVSGPSSYGFNQWGGAPGVTNDYEANVFVRGLKIQENHSYRVQYYMLMTSDVDSAQVDLRLMRGWYNSEKAFTTHGGQGAPEWTQIIKGSDLPAVPDGGQPQWYRYSYMTYYTNDSIANHAVHQNGYWWTDEWRGELWARRAQFDEETQKQFADNENLDSATNAKWGWIVQPDTYFLRFSFQGPHSTYQVDDITLLNSWIGGAEYNGDVLRVNFGYQTNLEDIANSDGVGQVEVPADAYDIIAYDPFFGDMSLKDEGLIIAAEFHNDGYLYIWIDDDFENYENVRFSLYNSVLPEEFKLKYTSETLFPRANDAEWIADGKIVPDFENETALPRPFSAVRRDLLPPSVVTTNPEPNSFGLGAGNKSIIVEFNKPVYAGKSGVAMVIPADENNPRQRDLTCVGYTDDTYKNVEFALPEGLDGNVNFKVFKALALNPDDPTRAADGAQEGKEFDFVLSFGTPDLSDTTTQAYKSYTLLATAYENALSVIEDCESDIEIYGGVAYEEFKATVAQYEPKAFLANNTAPSAFEAAAKTLDEGSDAMNARMTNVDNFATAIDNVGTYLGEKVDYAAYPEYESLNVAYLKACALDLTVLSNDELKAALDELNGEYTNAYKVFTTIDVTTTQIKSLAQLLKDLGFLLDPQGEIGSQVANNTEDNQKLAKVLKLMAKKEIYKKLANGESIDSIDATGFITNASLYFTGQLNKEIKEEYYQYAGRNRWALNSGAWTTVFPGWTIECTAGSVMCGEGFAPGDNREYGGYVEEGFATGGWVGADWTSGFYLQQEATDLPNGIFTLGLTYGGGEDNIANQYLTANGDTVAAGATQDLSDIALNGIKVEDGTMFIKANHVGVSAWARLDDFRLYMTGALEGFDYKAALEEVEKEINEAITFVDAEEIESGDATFYNINGVKSDAQKGLMIKVQNGKAIKVLY